MKLQVYIEDSSSSDILINDVHCRRLGDLANGEEKTFEIEEGAARIFVIADKLSKNYCNELYELPEGQEDVSLTGSNHFNPINGNAFRFDNNQSEAAIANRKRGTRRGIIVFVISLFVGVLLGYLIASSLLSL